MVKPLDRIMIGKVAGVIARINDDGTCTAVYNSGVHDVYEDVKFEDGKWSFVHSGVDAGYTKNAPHMQDAVRVLNMSPELRARIENARPPFGH